MAVFLLRLTLSSLATPVLLRLLCSWRMREEPTHAFRRANTERERERERELPQANPRQICEQLSALWRVLETVLHRAFSLWFLFPDFSTRRFYFYSHFGVLFHRIFFFPKFSEEVCGFVRGWILWCFSATVMDLRAFWHVFSLVRLLLCFSLSMRTRLSHKRVVAEMHLSRLRGDQIWWLIPVLKWLRKSLSFPVIFFLS